MTHKIKLTNEDYKKIIANEFDLDDIEDVERVFHKTCQSDNHPSNSFLMPCYPFKMMIIGKSNSGKTVLALNMLMEYLTSPP